MTRQRKRIADTWTTERADPVESVSRMLVRSSYRVPVEGKGSAPGLQPSDVAGALAFLRDPLQRETAVAVATRAPREDIARLTLMAYHRVATAIRHQRGERLLDLRKPEDRFRLRIVVFDAANELVWPERRRPFYAMAKAAKMRRAIYAAAFRLAYIELERALTDAGVNLRGHIG